MKKILGITAVTGIIIAICLTAIIVGSKDNGLKSNQFYTKSGGVITVNEGSVEEQKRALKERTDYYKMLGDNLIGDEEAQAKAKEKAKEQREREKASSTIDESRIIYIEAMDIANAAMFREYEKYRNMTIEEIEAMHDTEEGRTTIKRDILALMESGKLSDEELEAFKLLV